MTTAATTTTTTTSSSPPKYTDYPLPLIPTPKFKSKENDPFTLEGSYMAMSHNSFIRGFNSIYQQAPRVRLAADKADFAGYCTAWVECVHYHHHYEETEFFPNFEKAAGRTGLMQEAYDQHDAFEAGLKKFKDYLHQRGPTDWRSDELIGIMDEFKDAFHAHLAAEPDAIVNLRQYCPDPDNPIDIVAIAQAAGKKQVSVPVVLNTLPVFFLNIETVEFEGGMWHGVFPPLKGLARTIMLSVVPMWHSGRWRFVTCNTEGKVKDSLAV